MEAATTLDAMSVAWAPSAPWHSPEFEQQMPVDPLPAHENLACDSERGYNSTGGKVVPGSPGVAIRGCSPALLGWLFVAVLSFGIRAPHGCSWKVLLPTTEKMRWETERHKGKGWQQSARKGMLVPASITRPPLPQNLHASAHLHVQGPSSPAIPHVLCDHRHPHGGALMNIAPEIVVCVPDNPCMLPQLLLEVRQIGKR